MSDDGGGRTLIEAGALARLLDVPVSILSYFEARLKGVRALRESGQRFYRADDAALLAGISTLLYRDGMVFRDVAALLSADPQRVVALGRERLKGRVAFGATRTPSMPIPDDVVVSRGDADPAGAHAGPSEPRARRAATDAILAELLDCIRILEAARSK